MPINFTESGTITPSEAAEEIERFANEFDSKTNPINYSGKTIRAMRVSATLCRKYPILHSAAQHAAYDLAPNLHGDRNTEAARQILSEALKACEL